MQKCRLSVPVRPCVSLSVCSCVHGVCSRGPLGNGSCVCFAGYTGPLCDQGGRGCWQTGAAGPRWPEQERLLGEGWDPSLCPQPNFFLSRRGTQLVRGREGRLRPPTAHRPREGKAPARVNKVGRASLRLCSSQPGALGTTTPPPLHSELPVCRALNCPQNSQCSAEAPACSCLPGHKQQGRECRGKSVSCRPEAQALGEQGRPFKPSSTVWPFTASTTCP